MGKTRESRHRIMLIVPDMTTAAVILFPLSMDGHIRGEPAGTSLKGSLDIDSVQINTYMPCLALAVVSLDEEGSFNYFFILLNTKGTYIFFYYCK